MANELTDVDKWTPRSQLLSDKGVSKIVDLSIFDASNVEVTVKIGADISYKEGIAGLGDKDTVVGAFWPYS